MLSRDPRCVRPPRTVARAAPVPRSAESRAGAVLALQRRAGNRAVTTLLQRYPVSATSATTVASTAGRPTAKSNTSTIKEIVKRIYTQGPYNDFENALYLMGSQAAAAKAIDTGKWLSQNNAAICHKQAIDEVEEFVVAYANKVLAGTNSLAADNGMVNWVKGLTNGYPTQQANALIYLAGIKAATGGVFITAAQVAAGHCDSLIHAIDGSPANLFIGSAQTNSSVKTHLDMHYDVTNPGNVNAITASPVSRGIYDAQHAVAPNLNLVPMSPVRATDASGDWVESSSVPGIGWVLIDKTKNPV